MRYLLDNPRRRTLAGAALALAFVPLLLGVMACATLKTPVGDPEQGWADPRLSGVWLASGGEDTPVDYEAGLWVLEPFDARTWLLTWVGFEDSKPATEPAAEVPESSPPPLQRPDVLRILGTLKDDRAALQGLMLFKAWITTLGGRRFLVLEPRANPGTDRGLHPAGWMVMGIGLDGDRLRLSLIDEDVEDLGEVRSRGKAEEIIARHARDPAFFRDYEGLLYRIPRSAWDDVANVLERAGVQH